MFELKRRLASPRAKAERWAGKHDRDPTKFMIMTGFESSELRDFRDWLNTNHGTMFDGYGSINDIPDKVLKKVPEFATPSRDYLHDHVRETIYLLMGSIVLIVLGLVI